MSRTKAVPPFLEYVLDVMSLCGPVRSRSMFGGHGLYIHDRIFAILGDGSLYFKAKNEAAAEFFKQQGSERFGYEKHGHIVTMNYWKVPAEILEDPDRLQEWFRWTCP